MEGMGISVGAMRCIHCIRNMCSVWVLRIACGVHIMLGVLVCAGYVVCVWYVCAGGEECCAHSGYVVLAIKMLQVVSSAGATNFWGGYAWV